MIQERPFINVDWHTAEKVILTVVTTLLVALATVLRPWLAQYIFRLMRDHKAEYREMSRELNDDAFTQLEKAEESANKALQLAEALKARMEKAESTLEEQSGAISELRVIPSAIDRIETAMKDCLKDINDVKLSFAAAGGEKSRGRKRA